MTLKELDELLRENPSFIISLQNKCEMQEKEIAQLKDELGIKYASIALQLKAVNKIKEQAKEIEQLKQDAKDCTCQGGHSEAYLKAKGKL